MQIEVNDDDLDTVVVQMLRRSIETMQAWIENNTAEADDCQLVWHLMHAHNYYAPYAEHYDAN